MAIDEGRWRGLLDELTDLAAIRRGAIAQLTELHDRAGRQRSALARLEDQRRQRTGEDLPASVTFANLVHTPPADQRLAYRVQQVDHDRTIVQARAQLAEIDAAIARLDIRLAPIRQRIGELDGLRRKCLDWAAAQRPPVTLPDRGEQWVTATMPEASAAPSILDVPDAGGAGAAAFAAAGPAGAPPANGLLGAARDIFGRLAGRP
jgi:hypothetical protein